jgi:DNA-binding CsgD family transcriptional regulator
VAMTGRIEEFIEGTLRVRNPAELKCLYMKAIAEEGYENAVFASTINKQLVAIPWDEFPTGYLDAYQSLRWDKIDPVLRHVQVAKRPFRWADIVGKLSLTRKQYVFLNECKELGVHSGVTFPLHGPGSRVDLISLSLRQDHDIALHRLPFLYALTVQLWLRQNELTEKATVAASDIPHLTLHEVECLKWCKEGKTNWEIGERMDISEKTVEFHFSNIMRKLGATNRITAVVMGLQQGLIAL